MVKNTLEQPKPQRAPTPGSWKPGTSGNVRGRPKSGNALTEAIRAREGHEELVDIAFHLARHGEAESTRIAALNFLRDSGYTRPAEKHEIAAVTADEADDEQLAEQLTDAELEQLEALDQQRAAILARSMMLITDGRS